MMRSSSGETHVEEEKRKEVEVVVTCSSSSSSSVMEVVVVVVVDDDWEGDDEGEGSIVQQIHSLSLVKDVSCQANKRHVGQGEDGDDALPSHFLDVISIIYVVLLRTWL